MEKKRQFDQLNNFHHPSGCQNQHQGGKIKKRSSESDQFRQLNGTHFASNGNAATTAMHASNGGPPCNSSSTCSRSFSGNDDNRRHASVSEVVEFKFKDCSGENETPSFVVAPEIQELFGVDDLTFAPDLNPAHSLVFVADSVGTGSGQYTSDMLKLFSTEEVIQEFLSSNIFY